MLLQVQSADYCRMWVKGTKGLLLFPIRKKNMYLSLKSYFLKNRFRYFPPPLIILTAASCNWNLQNITSWHWCICEITSLSLRITLVKTELIRGGLVFQQEFLLLFCGKTVLLSVKQFLFKLGHDSN